MALATVQYASLGTTRTAIANLAFAARITLQGSGNGGIYIGGADVTVANGFLLNTLPSLTIELAASTPLYAVLDAAFPCRLYLLVSPV